MNILWHYLNRLWFILNAPNVGRCIDVKVMVIMTLTELSNVNVVKKSKSHFLVSARHVIRELGLQLTLTGVNSQEK